MASGKVVRLLADARVMPAGTAAVYRVKGDHGEYITVLGEDITFCSCAANRELCSHVQAAELLHGALEDARDLDALTAGAA